MSSSNCCFLNCIQVSQEASQVVGIPISFRIFHIFIAIHTVKGFGIVNKAEIDVLWELSCFFDDPVDVSNLISGSSAFSKTSLKIWKFTVDVLLKPGLENFEHYFTSLWDECNCAVVWALFGIAFLWDWNENWPFPVLQPIKIQTSLKAQSVEHALSIRPAGPDVLGPLSGADCACAAADSVQALGVRPDSGQCSKRTCHRQESEVGSVSHTWLPGSNVF